MEKVELESVDENNEEQVQKLQEAWNWVSDDLTRTIVEKEKEMEVELFFPLLMVCVDALKLRGMNPDEVRENVSMRLDMTLEEEVEEVEIEDEKN